MQITQPVFVPAEAPAQGANAAASPGSTGGLPGQDAAIVRGRLLQEVEGRYPELTTCFDRGREHDGTLQGRVTVRFTVAPSGDVVGVVDGGGTTLADKGVIACVQGAFTRMKFTPWEGKAVTAMLPIDFTSPE